MVKFPSARIFSSVSAFKHVFFRAFWFAWSFFVYSPLPYHFSNGPSLIWRPFISEFEGHGWQVLSALDIVAYLEEKPRSLVGVCLGEHFTRGVFNRTKYCIHVGTTALAISIEIPKRTWNERMICSTVVIVTQDYTIQHYKQSRDSYDTIWFTATWIW